MMHSEPSASLPPVPIFDDGRGRYPDRISAKVALGTRARLRRAAELAGTTSAEFIRDAIETRLRQASAATTSAQEA